MLAVSGKWNEEKFFVPQLKDLSASVLEGAFYFLSVYVLLKLLCTVDKVSVWNKQIQDIKRNSKILEETVRLINLKEILMNQIGHGW